MTLCLTGHCVQDRKGVVISSIVVAHKLRRPNVLLSALAAVVPSQWMPTMTYHVRGGNQERQTLVISRNGVAMAAALYTFATTIATTITFAESVAWIHIIGTRPAVQRRGYCRLMLAALQEHVGGGTTLCVESTSSMADIWMGSFGFTGQHPANGQRRLFTNTFFIERPPAGDIAAAKAAALLAVWAKMRERP